MPLFRRKASTAVPSLVPPNAFDVQLAGAAQAKQAAAAQAEALAIQKRVNCPSIDEILPAEDVALLDLFWASAAVQRCQQPGAHRSGLEWSEQRWQNDILWSGWTVMIGANDSGRPGHPVAGNRMIVAAADRSIRERHGTPVESSIRVVYGWAVGGGYENSDIWHDSDLLGVLNRITA